MDRLQRPARLTVIESSSSSNGSAVKPTAPGESDRLASSHTESGRPVDRGSGPAKAGEAPTNETRPARQLASTARTPTGPSASAKVSSESSSSASVSTSHPGSKIKTNGARAKPNATASASASASASTLQIEGTSEEAKLLRADQRRKEVLRRSEKWGDKMMEEVLDGVGEFKKGLRYITPSQYPMITHERHLNSLCSYPACPNPPSAPYRPQKRFVISSKNRTITETMGNAEEGFCSKACKARSSWVERELDRAGPILGRGKEWEKVELKLLEEYEDDDAGRGEREPSGAADLNRNQESNMMTARPESSALQSKAEFTRAAEKTGDRGESSTTLASSRQPGTPDKQTKQTLQPTKPATQLDGLGPSKTPLDPSGLIANLTIHEKPTFPPSTQTSLTSPSRALGQTSNSNSSLSPQTQTAPSAASPASRRHAPSLLATPSGLASTVLKASKTIGRNQLEPDSEDDVADQHLEWEKEVGLEWGEADEELKDVWEEARKAQEMMENGEA